jgi:hypothetical protein
MINGNYTNENGKEFNIKLDNSDYKLLKPAEYIIDDQDKVFKEINPPKYLTKGNPWEKDKKPIETANNHVLSLWSLKQVTSIWQKHQTDYTHVMYCRPDVTYVTPLNIRWFTFSDELYVSQYFRYGHTRAKICDRFAIGRPAEMAIFGNRFDEAYEFSKKHKLHSETFCAYIVKNAHIKTKLINFGFIRTRARGNINCTDVKQLLKKRIITKKRVRETEATYTRKARKLGILNVN